MLSIMLLRVAACSLCSGASQTICAPKASATIRPVSGGKYLAGHLDRGGEEQPVAVHPVVHPFLVGAEIRDRGLDLDDPDFAVGAQRHEVGAAARSQRQLADHAEAMRVQKPRGAARDLQRGLRLPAVDRQLPLALTSETLTVPLVPCRVP